MGKFPFRLFFSLVLLASCSKAAAPPPEPGPDPALTGRVIPMEVVSTPEGTEAPSALEEALEGFQVHDLEAVSQGPVQATSPGVVVTPQPPPAKIPVAQPPASQPPSPSKEEERFVEGHLIVRLHPGAVDAISTLHKRPGLEGLRFELGYWVSPDRAVLVIRPEDEPEGRISAEATRAILPTVLAQPEFGAAELDYIRQADAVVDDPYYGFMWHLHQLRMERAWEITTGSEEVVVAVLDTGVRTHADLNDRLLPGYDMISDPEAAEDGDGRDPDPSPAPGRWHGQHVAGTIGAETNNGVGIAGMDWKAKILPVRVLGKEGARASDTIAGIHWAIGDDVPDLPKNPHPADVLNMSLGGGSILEAEQEAIDAAVAAGAIVVVTAGNDDQDASRRSFSGYEGVIVVGATDYLGHRAPHSNWGRSVHVMAPGGDVTVDRNRDGQVDGVLSLVLSSNARGFQLAQGTSMAAPHVSGLVALMKALRPSLTYSEGALPSDGDGESREPMQQGVWGRAHRSCPGTAGCRAHERGEPTVTVRRDRQGGGRAR